jgi:hypothetical protein
MIGWIFLIPATIAGIILMSMDYETEWLNTKVFAIINDQFLFSNSVTFPNRKFFTVITANITNSLVAFLFILGAMMVAFAKEKTEDEYIAKLRLSSLLWSVWVNYIFLLLALAFVWGFSFFNVMVYNMFTILIIFIIRFNYLLYRSTNAMADEK